MLELVGAFHRHVDVVGLLLGQFGQLGADLVEVEAAVAREGSEFKVLARQIAVGGQQLELQGLSGVYTDIFLPLHGEHQARNAALALAAVEAFFGAGPDRQLDQDAIRNGFASIVNPGRLERVRSAPTVFLDAAHNPGGAESLAQALATTFGKPYAIGVIGVLGDKDATGFLELLDDSLVEVVITQSDSPRAVPATELAETARKVFGAERVHVAAHPLEAIALAKTLLPGAPTKGAIVVTGSITLIGQVLKLQQQEVDADVE